MDWSLVIFAVVVLWFAFRGYQNGLLKSVSRIVSLLAGYACAVLFTADFAHGIGSQLGLHGIIGMVVSGMILFFGASMFVGLVFWVVSKVLFENEKPSLASNLGGAAVGSLIGVLLGIVMVWALSFARDMNITGASSTASVHEPSGIENLANRVAGSAVSTALSMGPAGPEMARFSAALLESPGEIAQHGQRLMKGPELKALVQNPDNQQVLNSGDINALQKLPAFRALSKNPFPIPNPL